MPRLCRSVIAVEGLTEKHLTQNQRVRGSLLPRRTIIHVASPESMMPNGVARRWRKRHH
jgi:hypothetical protein